MAPMPQDRGRDNKTVTRMTYKSNTGAPGTRTPLASLSLSVVLLPLFASAGPAPHESYLLQPGDVVSISVFQEEGLDREVLIRPDGAMSFPFVGDIQVAGLSPLEAKRELEQRLGEFIPGVTTTISVTQISGNHVFVLGKVNRPGAYPIYRPLDVMQALALAGGTAQFAAVDDIRILRRDSSGLQEVHEFKYSAIMSGRHLEQNIALEAGDTIIVP
jgi:polysaccharide export outer membrane protein